MEEEFDEVNAMRLAKRRGAEKEPTKINDNVAHLNPAMSMVSL